MKRLRDISIRTKVSVLVVAACGVTLAIACAVISANLVALLRERTADEITSLASITGYNATAAVDFGDRNACREILQSLGRHNSVEYATLRNREGKLLATFEQSSREDDHMPPDGTPVDALNEPRRFTGDGHVDTLQDLYGPDGLYVGRLFVRANMNDMYRQQRESLTIIGAIFAGSMVLALVIAYWLQRVISQPILELARTTQHVTAKDDYTVRVAAKSGDEVGVLYRGFDAMMRRIERTKNELQQAHDELEERVLQRTEQLEYARSEAEAANRAKSQFLANMSHEIRTPMTAILGFSEMIRERTNDPTCIEWLETIQSNGHHLTSILNDILDLSKIEAGRFSVESISCSPIHVLAEVTSLMRVRADAKGLKLQLEYASDMPTAIQSDPTRVRQILINLVGNAIKFTSAGVVRLVASIEGRRDANPMFRVDVVDSGIGMTVEQIERIFHPFSQADASMSRRFGGTGLGLAISRRLCEILGGDIQVASEINQGSTFSARVATGPLEHVPFVDQPDEAALPARPSQSPPLEKVRLHCRVLLAEDGVDNQRIVSHLLRKAGAEVVVVENGRQAIDETLKSLNLGTPFDVTLMDMQMPVLDGYQATAELRAMGYSRPIIALTAHAMAGDRDLCLAAGCDNYATKPIDRWRLVSMVATYSKGNSADADSAMNDRDDAATNMQADEVETP